MYECMCECMYICIYVHMYVGMYFCMYVHMHVCMYVRMYVCMYVHMYVCVYVCVYECMIIFSNHVLYSTIKWTVFATWVLCTFLHETEPDKIWSFHRSVITEFCEYLLAAYACYVCCEFFLNISITYGGTVFYVI